MVSNYPVLVFAADFPPVFLNFIGVHTIFSLALVVYSRSRIFYITCKNYPAIFMPKKISISQKNLAFKGIEKINDLYYNFDNLGRNPERRTHPEMKTDVKLACKSVFVSGCVHRMDHPMLLERRRLSRRWRRVKCFPRCIAFVENGCQACL